MKIRELSITNCLSFCEKGLNDGNSIKLGDFNLFIGGNNAGKSNVLKVTEILSLIMRSAREPGTESLQDFPLLLEGEMSNFRDWVFNQEPRRKMDFSFTLEIEKADRAMAQILDNYDPPKDSKNPVLFMFNLKQDYPKILKVNGFIKYKDDRPLATVTKVEIPNDHSAYREEPILFDSANKKILSLKPDVPDDRLVWKVFRQHDEKIYRNELTSIGGTIHVFLAQLYDKIYKDLVINIHAIRKIEPLGDKIIESLNRLRDSEPRDRELEKSVVNYIRSLIFPDFRQEISFVYPEEDGRRHIKIQVGELQLPLNHYGSGVEQMLALAAQIVRHGSNKVILIEEPEAHFHPDLQRKFIRFLRDNQQTFAHQYFIASHSSIFAYDFIDMNGNVFYVHLEQSEAIKQKYSQIETLNAENLRDLLRDLGAKPQDLLFANGLLVVEGVTDKEVFTDWARKIGKPFERIALEVIDVKGAGNIKEYLLSNVIQKTCFQRYALFDKNAEDTVKNAVEGIVPDENIIALKKGDLEDYYPRELVLEFAKEFAPKKGKTPDEIPDEIKEGETVKKLSKLLNGDWWKRNLADKIIKEMKPEQIDDEIKDRLTEIYESVY